MAMLSHTRRILFPFYCRLSPLHPSADLVLELEIIVYCLLRSPQHHDRRHVDEQVGAVQGRGSGAAHLADLFPEADRLFAEFAAPLQFPGVEPAPGEPFQERDHLLELFLHVNMGVRGRFARQEGGVQEQERHLEMPGQGFVPLEHRAADVVAGHQQVRSRQSFHGRQLGAQDGTKVRTGVRTQVLGETRCLGRLAQCAGSLPGAAERPVLLRVHRVYIESQQQFDRSAAGHPGQRPPQRFSPEAVIARQQVVPGQRSFATAGWFPIRGSHVFSPYNLSPSHGQTLP